MTSMDSTMVKAIPHQNTAVGKAAIARQEPSVFCVESHITFLYVIPIVRQEQMIALLHMCMQYQGSLP